MFRLASLTALFVVVTAASSCGEKVVCENLCNNILICEVTFAPSDDPNGEKVENGERSELEHCSLGCEENPAANVENAKCVDAVLANDQNPATCQQPILDCFGAEIVNPT